MLHLYFEIKLISETVKKRNFNLVKAQKNSGPKCFGCFMRFTVITVDAKEGSYCTTYTGGYPMKNVPLTVE